MSCLSKKIKLRGTKVSTELGGGSPIRVQSMLNCHHLDKKNNVEQAKRLVDAGCEIIRMSVPNEDSLLTFREVVETTGIPIVADIHFNGDLAIKAAQCGASKIRINPGNIGDFETRLRICEKLKKFHIPIRVGVNFGSLEKDILEDEELTNSKKLAKSALRNVNLLEKELNFEDIVVSIKSSDVLTTVEANKYFFKKRPDIPIHIGITEAGTSFAGLIKSSIGISLLLEHGIGDTIRVSLTDDPILEVRAAYNILNDLNLRKFGAEIISCPTCGRTEVDLIEITKKIENELQVCKKPIKVAVMGCVVNGPGEARDADIGVACGKGSGVIFKHGEIIKKVDESEIINTLLTEIDKL